MLFYHLCLCFDPSAITYESIGRHAKAIQQQSVAMSKATLSYATAAFKDIPYRKVAATSAAIALSGAMFASARDYIHQQHIHVHALTCEPKVIQNATCHLHLFFDGITSHFGWKRLSISLIDQNTNKYNILFNKPIKPLLKNAFTSTTYPFLGFSTANVTIHLPDTHGRHRLGVRVHWPFQYGRFTTSPVFVIQ